MLKIKFYVKFKKKGECMFNNMNNQFDNNTKENTNIEQNNYPNDANIKPIMYKNENNMSQIMLRRILYLIIFILVVVIVILIIKKRPVVSTTKEEELNKTVSDYEEIIKTLGKEKYYQAINIYGDIILDTKLICGNMSKDTLVDNYYMKSQSTKFQTYKDLNNYIHSIFYGDIISSIITNNRFKNYNGILYCVSETRGKNAKYQGLEEMIIDSISNEKIEYTAKEKYLSDDENVSCQENCATTIKENKFTIEKKDNRWYVTVFTLPYL